MRAGIATRGNHRLEIALAIAQAVLALVFVSMGLVGLLAPISSLAPHAPWITALRPGLVRFIGGCEVAGAVGLVLPIVFPRRAAVAPWAAICLGLVMLLGSILHFTQREPGMLLVTLTLLGLC